ncbi:sensor histidine kinase [Paenibacillus contaminans]|uniref:HAMP domain-containing protein n=1 Tax=Paenibacillus contaminans TaxID=450362 RepID=A0A329MXK0_9BACL|nr:histidine kinase [Paenibacillus contaminans]RAV23093.1 hypothetical protein DQG23_02550 [Paenibacillus contaminans]
MLRKFSLRKLSIFPKLILTFLLITAPLFGLSLTLNELGKKEVQQQLNTTMASQIHYYFLSLEKEIEQIVRVQEEMVNDEDLQKLTGLLTILSHYEKMKALNELANKLKKIKESSQYIQNVSLFIPAVQDVITTSGDIPVTREQMESISLAGFNKGFPLIYWNDRLFLSVNFPHYNALNPSQNALQFIMQVELSAETVREELGKFHQQGETVLFSDYWAIGSHKDIGEFREINEKLTDQTAPKGVFTVSLDHGRSYVGIYEKSLSLDATVLFFLEENKLLGTLKSYRNWFWLLLGSSVVILCLFSYGIYLLIHRPLRDLVKLFKNVEKGDFNVAVKHKNQDEFGYLFKQFEKMLGNLKQLIDETYVQKMELQSSELKQLQSQIHPHFLYNSFFTLHRLIKNYDIDSAQLISKNLGEYFQYITRNAQAEVTLADEVGHVRSFTAIQGVRFSKRIQIEFEELPEKMANVRVPRLILQPIVENAFEHGLGEKMRSGLIRISFELSNQMVSIIVEDNGTDLDDSVIDGLRSKMERHVAGSESTGLINVHRRLRLKYGALSGLELSRSSFGGLQVRILIPTGSG